MKQKRDWQIFINSVFFVLGFSVIFSIVGVLLQSVLSDVSVQVQQWLGYIGGTVIIIFGLYLVHLIKIPFLEKEHKFKVKRMRYTYLTSFTFGAAFAVGWTPCVGAILGAILALAVTQGGQAFLLFFSYTIGLGLPFLVVGFFTDASSKWIQKSGKLLNKVSIFFGGLLILLGVLVFTNQLSKIAAIPFLSELLIMFSNTAPSAAMNLGLGVAFIAGLASFLSPCVLPLIPAFLAYLASTVVKR